MSVKRKQFITKYGFRLLLCAVLFLFFLAMGHNGPVLFDDSESYMQIGWREGVMPFYPVFLLLNQYFFGDTWYLWAVIVEQALLAAVAMTVLEETVRVRFGLHLAEGILLSLFALYPYTIELPVVMTQAILTEGVAYSLFYLLLAVLLTAVWNKSYGWLLGACGMTLLLASVRSQLQILFGVCGIVFLYVVCMRGEKACGGKKIFRILAGFAGCVAVSAAGILLVFGLVGEYRIMVQGGHPFNRFGLMVQRPESYRIVLEEERQKQAEAKATPEQKEAQEESEPVEEVPVAEVDMEEAGKRFSTSQYMTLIFSRGMYEADYEDAELFEDPILKGLYLALYEAVDAEEERYVYAEEGLWMWRDIVGGIGKIGMTCIWTPSQYYAAYAPEIILSDQFSEIRSSHMQTIGLTLIKAHFGRFLYHTLKLLPQAFISTVFFQFAPLYGFCHLVTALLYLSAFGLMVWGYADSRAQREEAETMALVLGTNVTMVLTISLVFFGQQRYLVYAFGPFYMAYYLLLRQLWHVRARDFIGQRFLTKKDDL